MPTITHTTRDLFRILFQYGRNEIKVRDAKSAFWAAEAAVDAYIHNFGYTHTDLEALLGTQRAVLWALHWSFFDRTAKDAPWFLSDMNLGFEIGLCSENRAWLVGPRFPDRGNSHETPLAA